MDIGNALRRSWIDDITIRSTISRVVASSLEYDVTVLSVKIHGNIIRVRTDNPLINSELSLKSGDIKKASLEKLWAMGIQLWKNIKFRFI